MQQAVLILGNEWESEKMKKVVNWKVFHIREVEKKGLEGYCRMKIIRRKLEVT